MKLLLINPKFRESFWSFSWAIQNVTTETKTLNSPLGLATLAALTPAEWSIEIVDENVEPIDWMAQADIVGVCGMGVQASRQKEILAHFKKRGIFVVAGGSYASLCPEEYEGLADAVISGEAENIWPRFCLDFAAGQAKKLYKETETVLLQDSPCPRFDLLKLDRYQRVSLQFSRGCPFQCEFCDIIVMFGRTPRNKSIPQMEKELDLLRQLGVKGVFFVDDNFIGNRRLAKEMLFFLAEYQERHQYRFNFGTEASINLADDPILLNAMKRANFEWVFMGIESPNEASLKETGKIQNLKGSLLEKIQRIYAAGIDIMAGFIIGFDADDKDIFQRQYHFIEEAGIIVAMVGLLTAIPKTPLYRRLKEQHRLKAFENSDNTSIFTNVVPLQMSSEELSQGYIELLHRLTQDRSIYLRLSNKFRFLQDPSAYSDLDRKTQWNYFWRFFLKGIIAGGPRRIYYFSRSVLFGFKNPKVLSLIIGDWIAAISLRSFAHRHFEKTLPSRERSFQHFQKTLVEKVFRKVQQEVFLKISEWQGREKIWIGLKDQVDKKVIKVLGKSIRRYLKRYQGAIVLDFRGIRESCLNQLKPLLNRLGKNGDQIQFYLTQDAYQKLQQELAPFQYTLASLES